ncbi:hypothetical protein GCM10010464_05850 [Pseudonocardia yunnanensis]
MAAIHMLPAYPALPDRPNWSHSIVPDRAGWDGDISATVAHRDESAVVPITDGRALD